ncbi:DUF6665 family protein [Roseibium litorale]|uniref:Uncharacterized protein n=1 Tax=Roseibium litorale TaxID=2803841 RepID=A0ABR9CLZ3_9HYPH|nr:DUF6665 family protein [Roseibium litorale]MBD8891430.1 hypothetical protein [Roseibium litorale]
MSVRPPKAFSAKETDPITAALEQEILGEKIGTLSRLNKKLEAALKQIPAEEDIRNEKERLIRQLRIAEAGEALWHVTIQRELCGLLKHQAFFNEMGVPKEVRLSCGPVPAHLREATGKR